MRTMVLSKGFYVFVVFMALAALCLFGCFSDKSEKEAVLVDDEIYVELSDDGSRFSYSIDGDASAADANDAGIMHQGELVTISKGGTYVLSGSLAGAVHVDAPGEDVSLILDGVDIKCADGPAILFKDAGAASIAMNAGTENSIADGGDSDYDGALYGCVSYSIGGDGALIINGNSNEGIASEMHLTVNGGSIDITAVDDGMNANNDGVSEITVNGGSITINAGGDGIDSNGTISITGGTVVSYGAVYDNNSGLDADGGISITGGTVFAAGANSPAPTDDSQDFLVFNLDAEQEKGNVSVKKGEEELFSSEAPQSFMSVFYSAEGLTDDAQYELFINGVTVAAATTGTSAQAGMQPPAGTPGDMQMPQEGEMPQGYGEGMTPPEMPEGGAPPEIPEGGIPQEMPEGEMPQEMPEGMQPGTTPPEGSGGGAIPTEIPADDMQQAQEQT